MIEPSDTPESLAGKIHALEHTHFPKVIEQVIELKKINEVFDYDIDLYVQHLLRLHNKSGLADGYMTGPDTIL